MGEPTVFAMGPDGKVRTLFKPALAIDDLLRNLDYQDASDYLYTRTGVGQLEINKKDIAVVLNEYAHKVANQIVQHIHRVVREQHNDLILEHAETLRKVAPAPSPNSRRIRDPEPEPDE